MRFVPIKKEAEQAMARVHRVRERLIGQLTQIINMLRGQMAEFGIVAPKGPSHVKELITRLGDPASLPEGLRQVLWVWCQCWPPPTSKSPPSKRACWRGTSRPPGPIRLGRISKKGRCLSAPAADQQPTRGLDGMDSSLRHRMRQGWIAESTNGGVTHETRHLP
jgi:hypothetical protein